MNPLRAISVFAFCATIAAAQPTITSVTNAASYVPAGLPNAGLARGALFVVKGANLGPTDFVTATEFPLKENLAGTSIRVTVAGNSVAAIMDYTGAAQVAAILPSTVPAGSGTLTVTYNGETSAPAPITVVENAIGIFTVASSGIGDAVATLGSGFVAPTNAANPGETVTFWGTGLGPVTFDETTAAVPGDMTSVPLEAFVGGKQAAVSFRGRNSCCAAVDTIAVEIPAGVAGCATPVTFKIGNVVSNTTTIAVAASGRTCTPTAPGLSASELANLVSKGTIAIGNVGLLRSVSLVPATTADGVTVPGTIRRTDIGVATFSKITIGPGGFGLGGTLLDIASFGSCLVSSFSGTEGSVPASPVQSLDAGAPITVNGPAGSKTITRSTSGGITSYFETFDITGSYLNAGQYTITGPGGPDVGSFTIPLAVAEPLSWTNQTDTTTVNRARGVTVTWSGGDPAGYVQITGSSFVGAPGPRTGTAVFVCNAKISDRSFTVPPVVLLALPPTAPPGPFGPIFGTLAISNISGSAKFEASGLDLGVATSSASSGSSVTYQ